MTLQDGTGYAPYKEMPAYPKEIDTSLDEIEVAFTRLAVLDEAMGAESVSVDTYTDVITFIGREALEFSNVKDEYIETFIREDYEVGREGILAWIGKGIEAVVKTFMKWIRSLVGWWDRMMANNVDPSETLETLKELNKDEKTPLSRDNVLAYMLGSDPSVLTTKSNIRDLMLRIRSKAYHEECVAHLLSVIETLYPISVMNTGTSGDYAVNVIDNVLHIVPPELDSKLIKMVDGLREEATKHFDKENRQHGGTAVPICFHGVVVPVDGKYVSTGFGLAVRTVNSKSKDSKIVTSAKKFTSTADMKDDGTVVKVIDPAKAPTAGLLNYVADSMEFGTDIAKLLSSVMAVSDININVKLLSRDIENIPASIKGERIKAVIANGEVSLKSALVKQLIVNFNAVIEGVRDLQKSVISATTIERDLNTFIKRLEKDETLADVVRNSPLIITL